jgi:hypothetical protein
MHHTYFPHMIVGPNAPQSANFTFHNYINENALTFEGSKGVAGAN